MSKENIIKDLKGMIKGHKFEPYIKHIRFPFIKNLEPGLKIQFDFPFTALVGQNGTNKSAVLRALYGSPKDYNLGNFWFSTALDPIDESGGRARFIYCYYQPDAKRYVEIIKTRIKRTYKKSHAINPDYWEPSRPIISDGMERMPSMDAVSAGRDKTRWKLIEKNVVFLDFRSKISAFDKYFYHGDLRQTLRHNSKQDFIRSKSPHLKEVSENGLHSKKMYRGRKEQVLYNKTLSEDQVEIISIILGREYQEVNIIKHRFFKAVGESVVLRSKGLKYSEAFAGSGEFAVVMLISELFDAPPASLILLDEPEVSLHPGAQERLVDFLLRKIKSDRHQVIVGTHSPYIINGLPENAIKTLYLDPSNNKIKVINETVPSQAFFHLGVQDEDKITIFVEDRLAKELVVAALRMLGEALYQKFSVIYPPGGASAILGGYLVAYARTSRKDAFFLMDGDQRPKVSIDFHREFQFVNDDELRLDVNSVVGFDPELTTDGSGEVRSTQVREARIRILEYAKIYLDYLPGENPEAFIWERMDHSKFGISSDYKCKMSHKERFRFLCIKELGRASFEDVNADEIFELQKRCVASVDPLEFSQLSGIVKSFASV